MASEMGNNTPEFCAKCGAPLAAGTKFCPKCGASIINQVYRKGFGRVEDAVNVPEEAAAKQPAEPVEPEILQEHEEAYSEETSSELEPEVKKERPKRSRAAYTLRKKNAEAGEKKRERVSGEAAGKAAGEAAGKALLILKTVGAAILSGLGIALTFCGKMWRKSPRVFIGAVTAIFIMILILALSGSKSYRKPLANYIKGVNDQNTESVLSTFPSQITDENTTYGKTVKKSVETMIADAKKDYGNYKITYDVTNTVKLGDKEISEIEVRYLQKYKADINFTAGYDLKTEYTINYQENGKDKNDTKTLHFIVIKSGGKWYLDYLTSDL